MLKTSESNESLTRPGKGGVRVDDNSKAGRGGNKLDGIEIYGGEIDGGGVGDNEVGKKIQNLTKFKKLSKSKETVGSDFLTPEARLAFTKLRQAFVNSTTLTQNDISELKQMYQAIQLIESLINWLLRVDGIRWPFFFCKMIPAETRYETYNGELLAIIETFKTWRHYLEGSQHKVLILTNHDNLRQFMKTKNLSFRQVCCIQELSRYYFRIEYRQDKVNGADNILFHYLQHSAEEEENFFIENVKIFYRLQFSLARVFGLLTSHLSSLHQIFICRTTVFSQLHRFWDFSQSEIARDNLYIANIWSMRLQLPELQDKDEEAKALEAAGLPED